jgi:hypothetical protein
MNTLKTNLINKIKAIKKETVISYISLFKQQLVYKLSKIGRQIYQLPLKLDTIKEDLVITINNYTISSFYYSLEEAELTAIAKYDNKQAYLRGASLDLIVQNLQYAIDEDLFIEDLVRKVEDWKVIN